MNETKDYFSHMIGQENVKKKLNFYIKAFNKTSICPFLNLVGAAGLGKTQFAKEFAKNLKNEDGSPRPLLEINCSTIKNNEAFFEQIWPVIQDQEEVVTIFDEAHALPKDLTNAFLTIFNTEQTHIKDFHWEEQVFTFNFKKQTFLFATTESDKLFPPLKDRLTTIDFEPYESDELGKIIQSKVPDVKFTPDTLHQIAKTTRGNARNAVMRAKEVMLFCEAENSPIFDENSFKKFCNTLGILPHGVTCTERQLLKILAERGECTLSMLSAATGLSATSIRKDHEQYLLRKNFIQINVKRKITSDGRKILESNLV
jgi:Holliday junction resolvasome RuvABC ATP-dependent DNA helicase subunit